VSLHAALKQGNDVAVVRVLSEAKSTTIVHELFELFGLVSA
jgi:hypothetical protein